VGYAQHWHDPPPLADETCRAKNVERALMTIVPTAPSEF